MLQKRGSQLLPLQHKSGRYRCDKTQFENPVLVSDYSIDHGRRGPASKTRGIMDRADMSGQVRGLISTTNRRRRFYFHFLPFQEILVPF